MSDLIQSCTLGVLATFSAMQVVINRRMRHRVEKLEVDAAFERAVGGREAAIAEAMYRNAQTAETGAASVAWRQAAAMVKKRSLKP